MGILKQAIQEKIMVEKGGNSILKKSLVEKEHKDIEQRKAQAAKPKETAKTKETAKPVKPLPSNGSIMSTDTFYKNLSPIGKLEYNVKNKLNEGKNALLNIAYGAGDQLSKPLEPLLDALTVTREEKAIANKETPEQIEAAKRLDLLSEQNEERKFKKIPNQSWTREDMTADDKVSETAGRVGGELFKALYTYGAAAPISKALPLVNKINNPFVRAVVTDQIADNIVQTPGKIVSGIANKENPGTVIKDIAKQNAVDAVTNLAVGGASEGIKAIKQAKDESKALKNIDLKMKQYTDQKGLFPSSNVNIPTNNIEPVKGVKSVKPTIDNSSDAEKLFAINPALRPKAKSPVNEGINITDDVKVVNSKDIKTKTNMSKAEQVYTKLVDNQYAINKFSKESGNDTTKVLASNSRNAQGTVSHILKNNLVDKEGKTLGGSFKEIIDKVPKSQEEDFTKYMLHRHNISRMKVDKPVFGKNVTADDSLKKLSEYESKYPEFKNTAEKYDKFMNDFMEEWGVKSGLIKEDVWKALKEKYPNYVPTYRVLNEVTGAKTLGTKQGYVDVSSPLKKATGSDKPVINPLEKSMELVDKTVKAAKYNEVGQSIVSELRKNPDSLKGWAEIVEDTGDDALKTMDDTDIEGSIDEFNKQFDVTVKKPKLNAPDIVRVMENGKPVYIKINDRDFFEAITGLLVPNLGTAEKVGRVITKPFKALITTSNPIFAFRNLFRDVPTSYVNGSEKNPVKFVSDLVDAAKDMANNSEMFKVYKALGGGESNYVKGDLDKLYDTGKIPVLSPAAKGINKFNNFIESIPRYAEYKRTVIKGGNTFEAKMKGLYNANEVTTNFARQGNVTKSFDAWIPYLNASFQGLDKLVRQVKENPKLTVGKGIVAITIPAVAVGVLNKDNKYYDELSNRTKDNYYCIPNFGDRDNNGVPKTFIKIPKSREYGVMLATLFERAYRTAKGEKGSFKGFGNTVANNFVPPTDTVLQPIFNLKSNKDFADRDIVPMALQGRSPRYQYDDQTTEIAKFLGDKFNISPKQIDYIVKSYTGVVGQLGAPATTKSTYTGDIKGNLLNPITSQFKADPLFSNEAVSQFYNNKDKLDTAIKDYKFTNNTGKYYDESLRSQFNEYSDTLSDLYKQLKTTKDKKQIESVRRSILDTAKRANSLFESSTK